MFEFQGQPFAGSMDLSSPDMEGVPPHWALYFHTGDLNAALKRVSSNGGQVVHGPFEVPDVGWMAICQDNCGAHFNLHQPSMEGDGELPAIPVDWIEQMGPDRAKAVEFYKAVMGWGSMEMPMPSGEHGEMYSMFTINEVPVGGCMTMGAETGVPPNWSIYFEVADLDAAMGAVKSAGGNIVHEKMQIGDFGSIAFGQDPTGAVFGLHQPPASG